jgi:hypothetical protein
VSLVAASWIAREGFTQKLSRSLKAPALKISNILGYD